MTTIHKQNGNTLNKTGKFWNKVAKKYASKPVPDQSIYDEKIKLTQSLMAPEMQVMEFGCGTGSTALLHASYIKSVWATDISDEMIKIAKSKASKQNITNVNFECISIDSMQLPKDSFDMVMGHSILHLLENKDQVIKRVFASLKPGGWFVTSTTCMGDNLSFFKWVAPIGQLFGVLPTLNVFTRKNLINAITNSGFRIKHQWQPNDGHNLFLMAQKPK